MEKKVPSYDEIKKAMPSYDQIMKAIPLIDRMMYEKECRSDIKYYIACGLIGGGAAASGSIIGPIVCTGLGLALAIKRYRDRPRR